MRLRIKSNGLRVKLIGVIAPVSYLYATDDGNGHMQMFARNIASTDDGNGHVQVTATNLKSMNDGQGNVTLSLRFR